MNETKLKAVDAASDTASASLRVGEKAGDR